jgi:hypothetical protein
LLFHRPSPGTPLGRSALLTAAILLPGACALGVHALTASLLAAAIALGIGALLARQAAALGLRAEREQSGALAADSLAEVIRAAQQQRTRVEEQLIGLASELATVLASLEEECQTQVVAVEETASLQANINGSIVAINREVESLTRANEESASSILELGSAIE